VNISAQDCTAAVRLSVCHGTVLDERASQCHATASH